jgi:hypothetical protein
MSQRSSHTQLVPILQNCLATQAQAQTKALSAALAKPTHTKNFLRSSTMRMI